MKLGEAITETAELMLENPVVTTPYTLPSTIVECCFTMDVLAEIGAQTDPLRNDKSDWIWWYGNSFSTANMILQRWSGSSWVDVATLTDDTFGTISAFAFFTNSFGERGMGYLLDWWKIINHVDGGEASFRIKTVETPLFGAAINRYSWEYCLRNWTVDREQETVKVEWNMNGKVGDADNDRKRRDFGSQNRYNQIRLPGNFGFPTAPFESEYVKYQSENPGYGKEVWISNKYFDQFALELYPIPSYLHEFLKNDMMLADDVRISDFNSNNPTHYIQKYVKAASNWEPNWNFGSKNASVTIKFEDLYQNRNHKRC